MIYTDTNLFRPYLFVVSILLILFLASAFFLIANPVAAQTTATLALSPTTNTVAQNQTFTVTMNLNTAGGPTDGVDVYSLRFNPAILQVEDSNTSVAGIQIAPGSLLLDANGQPGTVVNSVNNSAGTIQFSQATAGGTTYTGSGIFATITFRGIANGTSNVTFDFTAGNTSDTNVAYQGTDRLSSVTNASFTVNTFDFSMNNGGSRTVTQGSNVTNTITATLASGTASAATFSASGLPTGVSAAFSPTSCNPTCTTTLTLTATASATVGTTTATVTGTAGSVVRNTTFSLTVNSSSYQRTINIASVEARTSRIITATLEVLTSPAKTLITSSSFTTNSAGNATITFTTNPTTVYLKVRATPFLTRLIQVDLNNNVTYNFPQLLIGDIDGNNIINSIDYSTLNTNWFTANAAGDLDQNGIVNSIDFSYMNIHWLMSGEV